MGSALSTLGAEKGLDLIALGRSELDITDAISIASAFVKHKPGILINAGAYTSVDKAESEAGLAFAINETAVALLADACASSNIPMLHISTDYVFDGSKEGLYSEEDSVNPLAVYAKSKEAGERALREHLEHHIILRTSWVFGSKGNNFVKTMVRLATERDQLKVVADQFGGPSSARGIAETLLTIVAQYENGVEFAWGTYHYCQKPYVSWYQFAEVVVARAINKGLISHPVEVVPIRSSEFPTPVTRPLNSRLDTRKLIKAYHLKELGWATDLEYVLDDLNIKSTS